MVFYFGVGQKNYKVNQDYPVILSQYNWKSMCPNLEPYLNVRGVDNESDQVVRSNCYYGRWS